MFLVLAEILLAHHFQVVCSQTVALNTFLEWCDHGIVKSINVINLNFDVTLELCNDEK